MSAAFFQQIEEILHTERIDLYRRYGADHTVTLARYTLNMALSESLYPAMASDPILPRTRFPTRTRMMTTVTATTACRLNGQVASFLPTKSSLMARKYKSSFVANKIELQA